jgi:antirestriction protein ArdC
MTTTSDSTTSPRNDVYSRVTNRIVEQLERGVRPWHQPWNARHAAGSITRPLRHNGQPYKGINILMLWDAAEQQGYACPIWLTFLQVKHLGGSVRKGQRGSPVVYANKFTTAKHDDAGDEIEEEHFFLKEYTVFNVEQCDGLPEQFSRLAECPKGNGECIEHAELFFASTGAKIENGGNRAYYAIDSDSIHIPPRETFRDSESHASTVAHELTHWTRHPSRLNRDLGRKRWGDEGYAIEELVAELGATFLCADLSISPEVREDHASYIENWLKVLKDDKRVIFTAASHASRAADFLHGLQPKPAF